MQDQISLDTEADTEQFARALAPRCQLGDVIGLQGPVGVGKTLFARAFIRELTGAQEVPSPSFTLVQTYETEGVEVWHADLYRLAEIDELLELGLTDAFDTAICLIEWPERLGSFAPPQLTTLRFTIPDSTEDRRDVTITGPATARLLDTAA
ncbi:tRNA (adenosine(37)-N6)-threonylcarbamoyltransferase complex ATPase subunit type 1 TsaE [Paracoccaceae bacterium GXU_MW_L88]